MASCPFIRNHTTAEGACFFCGWTPSSDPLKQAVADAEAKAAQYKREGIEREQGARKDGFRSGLRVARAAMCDACDENVKIVVDKSVLHGYYHEQDDGTRQACSAKAIVDIFIGMDLSEDDKLAFNVPSLVGEADAVS